MPKIILASSSPHRHTLLVDAGYDVEVVAPDETAEGQMPDGMPPSEVVSRLAYRKAADVARRLPDGIVVACDTLAECEGRILGKPTDEADARAMLDHLSGRRHCVYSGLCLWPRPGARAILRVETTTLQMDRVPADEIQSYLESGEWAEKAGAFGYQDRPGWLHLVEGSESNVIGLPLERLEQLLVVLGLERR